MTMTSQRRRILLIFLGLAGLLLAIWWLLAHRQKPESAPTLPKVGVEAARSQDVQQTLDVIGTVQPTVSAVVRAQLAGTIFAIDAKEGQMVRKDQRLAQIDPRPYRLAIAQAQGALTRDSAQLAVARTDHARYQRLLAQQSVAQQQVDAQQGTVKQLEGTVAADRAALGTAQLNLRYTEIVAPISGRVGLRHADLGNYVTPSDTNGVFTITVDDPIDISFAVPQEKIGDLGGRPPEQIAVSARRQSDGKILATGHLLAIDNQADGSTGTVTAKARFANGDHRLFPSQFVNVGATFGTLSGAVVVPVSAIRHGTQGDFLFTVADDHSARIRKVRTGPGIGDRIAILDGVRAGETVVVTGGDTLDDGVRVDPQPNTGQPR
jgi:membrane fusion protein, multidrug efflux system